MSDHLRGYGWRHATWCRWEKAQGTCDCGLREHQDAASPPAADTERSDPLDVERLTWVLDLYPVEDALDLTTREFAQRIAAAYAADEQEPKA